jgi:proteasome alpha subunit
MQQPGQQNYMAYDRTIVVFSPEGRLLQVEYARQAVKRGSTSLGIRTKDSVVIATTKIAAPLAVLQSYKVFEVDNHIGIVSSGLLADARDLAEMARIKAQINKITYGESISVSSLTRYICDRKHVVTQYAGVRPYGVGLLIGGIDEKGTRLYETDPSGTMIEWNAHAIGRGAEKATKVLEKSYSEDMSTEDGIGLILKALRTGEKEEAESVEVAVIDKSGFRALSQAEIKKLG